MAAPWPDHFCTYLTTCLAPQRKGANEIPATLIDQLPFITVPANHAPSALYCARS